MIVAAPKRKYGGISAEERRVQRRKRIIDAAICAYGKHGYSNSTVKAICETAGLTERYFYESFANREALLAASFENVTALVLSTLETISREHLGTPTERSRAMLFAFYQLLKDERNAARLFLIEIAGVSPAVDAILAKTLSEVGELFSKTLTGNGRKGRKATARLIRDGVMGGIFHIALSWVTGGYNQPLKQVVDDALRLCLLLQATDV